jgi:DNA-binding response OmpR family regulator
VRHIGLGGSVATPWTDRSRVVVVDDDVSIAELMRDFLEADGFSAELAYDGEQALAALECAPADCVLLDVMMPGESGFDVVRRIREFSDVPVLFLSARDADTDKIRGLGLGADDYISKSASAGEVVARVRAAVRRYRTSRPSTIGAVLDFGRLKINLPAREVLVNGTPVPFTAKEFDLLALLAQHPRQVFTREQLYGQLWGEFGERHTVTVHVGRVREKIEPNPSQPEYIVTVFGVGYRFEGQRR